MLSSYFYAYFAADIPKNTDFSCVSTLIVAAHTRIWILSALRLSVHACIWILSALRIPVHKNIGASANISLLSPKEIYEPADLKSEKLLQGVLIFSCNSLLYINYACQHHFCIFFLHASECQRADTSRATVHNDSQRSENPRATVHNDSQHADISRATLKVTTSVLTEQN